MQQFVEQVEAQVRAFHEDQSGQGLMEYGLAAVIVVALFLLVKDNFLRSVGNLFGRIDAQIDSTTP
jgi:Flp pilus assembly pilin Flp